MLIRDKIIAQDGETSVSEGFTYVNTGDWQPASFLVKSATEQTIAQEKTTRNSRTRSLKRLSGLQQTLEVNSSLYVYQ